MSPILSSILLALVGSGITMAGHWLASRGTTPAIPPGTPAAPAVVPTADPFAAFPGLPGHPALNALNAALHQVTASQAQSAALSLLGSVLSGYVAPTTVAAATPTTTPATK